ncbi:MAG: hypothetical protein SCALA702_01610 [Melioribacteraceae bacterium]|nr:MAG: hypothetical protein SCALA702_01610 [Melioribacteraceae bacterium]
MKIICLILLFISSIQLAQLQRLPELEDKYIAESESNLLILASSAQTWEAHEILVNNTKYTLGISNDYRVKHISTVDSDFISPEGLKIGDSISKISNKESLNIKEERGWGIYGTLDSGWFVFLGGVPGSDSINMQNVLTEGKISMFFKR